MILPKMVVTTLLLAVVVIAGCTAAPQQEQRMEDGTMVKPDGTMVKPDGTMVKPDGTMVKPDGTMVKPDGTMVKPDGTMVKPDGTMILPNGTMVEPEQAMPRNESMEKTEESMVKYSGTVFAGSASPLIDFNKADYDRALATDNLIVLYFYADWCPICRFEVPGALEPAFNELTTSGVIGFRVNFNDGFTDDDERNLARQFGVAYQHTKVFLRNGEQVLKSPESWDRARYLSEIAARV